MANLQYINEQLGVPEEEEKGFLARAVSTIDAPRQFLLEKTIEGISGEDVERGNLNFGDVTEGLLGNQFMANNPKTYAALSTAGDILFDPLNLPIFKGAKGLLGMAGSLPYLAKQAKSPNLADAALTQDITRMTKGYEQNHPRSVTIAGKEHTMPNWYGPSHAKPMHLAHGVGRLAGDVAQMAVDPKSAAIFSKYGVSPTNAREIERLVSNLNNPDATKVHYDLLGLKRTATDKPVNKNAVMNELHSQLAYTSSILRKYIPNDARREAFEKDLGPYLFPKQRAGTVTEFKNNPNMIRETLELPDSISDNVILNHIANRVPKGFGQELSGNITINSKPYQNSASKSAAFGQVKTQSYQDFLDTLKEFSGSKTPINLETIRKAAENKFKNTSLSKPKQKQRVDEMMSKLTDSDGYISIQGTRLVEDRLLAHINQIMLVKKGSKKQKRGTGDPHQDGFVILYDQMKQGSGSNLAEKVFDLGSKNNFIAVDSAPFQIGPKKSPSKKREGIYEGELFYGQKVENPRVSSVISQTPDPSLTMLSPQRVEDISSKAMDIINYRPTISEYGSQIQDRLADINLLQKTQKEEDELAY